MSPSREWRVGSPRVPSNDGQVINNLPMELFVHIFEIVYALYSTREIGTDINWTVPYQLVCRRWRDVIRSTPQFWQKIKVSSSPQWLAFCLTRCDGAPASVVVRNPTSPDAIFGLLRRHASSIRAFHLHCDIPHLNDLSGLPSLLAMPLLVLETMQIIGPSEDGEVVDVPLTHRLVPCLTSLYLRYCTAPRDLALYTSLRSLVLVGTPWTISYSDFLDVLGKCRGLERLRLHREVLDPFAQEVAHRSTGTQHHTPPLVLPRLWSMAVQGPREVLVHFLATIHVPNAIVMMLENNWDNAEPAPLVTRLLAPNLQLRIPFLSSLRTVLLNCWDRVPFQLSFLGGPDRDACFCVDYGTLYHHSDWPTNTYLECNLVAVMDIFSVATVDTLEVEGCVDLIAVGTWQRVFQTFSSLRTLRVRGRGTLDSLWSGLARATRSSLERGGAACCPSLSVIGINDRSRDASCSKFTATAQLFDIVRGALSARDNAGATRLQRLEMRLGYKDELWTGTAERRATWVEDVKELVDELDYRDWKM